MILDFTTTATIRPELLYPTYESFCKNLQNVDFKQCTLYLNIDPIPKNDFDTKVEEMKKIASFFFGKVVINIPEKPHFTRAQIWCWRSTTEKLVFNLQDDWLLLEKVDINDLTQLLNQNSNLCQIALRGYDTNYSSYRGVLSPALCLGKYCRRVSKHFKIDMNPEMQLKNPRKLHWVKDYNKKDIFILGYPEDSKHIILQDIGREWILKQPFDRPPLDKPYDFFKWVERQ